MPRKNSLVDLWRALERLQSGTPERVPLGTTITKDAVALEAGLSKGSIKRSRVVYQELIAAIQNAPSVRKFGRSREKTEREQKLELKVNRLTAKVKELQTLLNQAIVNEISLLKQNVHLANQDIAKGKGNVSPIKRELGPE